MLGKTYRFSVNNGCGSAVTVTVKRLEWKFTSAGALVFGTETTDGTLNALSVTAGAYSDGATIDNSTNLYLGAYLEVTMAPSASVTGTVSVLIQRSLDGGTTWPADTEGEFVCAHYFSASATSVITQGSVSGG